MTVRHLPASLQSREGAPFLVGDIDGSDCVSIDGEPGPGDTVDVAGNRADVFKQRPPFREPPPTVDILPEFVRNGHHDQVSAPYLTVHLVHPVQADGLAVGEVQPEDGREKAGGQVEHKEHGNAHDGPF